MKKDKKEYEILDDKHFLAKLFNFIFYKFKDIKDNFGVKKFKDYGMLVYVGRQGSGKTISLVHELERVRKKYPDVKILTNFGYINQDEALTSWQQVLDRRNDGGIIFAFDEIQNEFDVNDSRKFNLDILKVVTQQRKQGIKIYATSQVFTRVSKPLREQAYEVVECKTLAGRWTFQKAFDADEYNLYFDNDDPDKKFKVRRIWRKNFVQTDKIRSLFDSYAVIESMTKLIKSSM